MSVSTFFLIDFFIVWFCSLLLSIFWYMDGKYYYENGEDDDDKQMGKNMMFVGIARILAWVV